MPLSQRITRMLDALREPASLLHLSGPDLDLTLRVLRRAKLLGLVARRLTPVQLAQLPSRVVDQLVSAANMVDARVRLARWELWHLQRALQPTPARPVVVLKGAAYLLLDLPHSAGRLLTDVDLLVPEGQLRGVEAQLHDCGWESTPLSPYDERYYRDWTHEIPPLRHAEREIEVDVHHNILMRTARLRPDAEKLLAHSRMIGSDGFQVLAPVDMVLHAMTHLFYSSEMDDALRELVDIDALIRHFAASESGFWSRFVARAGEMDLLRPACYALRYAQRWLDTPVPPAVLQEMAGSEAPAPHLAVMDRLVPHALFPRHPDRPERRSAVARALLLVRLHWIRMPPWLLVRHLLRKLIVRIGTPRSEA